MSTLERPRFRAAVRESARSCQKFRVPRCVCRSNVPPAIDRKDAKPWRASGRPARVRRRMADSAALLADEVLPAKPIRQWVLSLPFAPVRADQPVSTCAKHPASEPLWRAQHLDSLFTNSRVRWSQPQVAV